MVVFTACGCGVDTPTVNGEVSVEILDGSSRLSIPVPVGSSVAAALEKGGVVLDPLDRCDPPSFTVITAPVSVTVTRVTEEYEVEEKVIPFERQTVRNESLPEGETLLIQAGENGLQRITYRRLFENGVQTSRSVFEVTTISEARHEIVMVGVQAPFTPVDIPGRLVYLLAGNAWLMEGSSANRRPILTSGDLDGRVFSLSPDGRWLLCTRTASPADEQINSLWVIDLENHDAEPVDLEISNIIHYAGWDPDGGLAIYYSTVEPRSTAPGWQANNDLIWLSFSAGGLHENTETILEANTGGIYGWWGTHYIWSPDGERLAYARPDSVGLVDFEQKSSQTLFELIPFQTGGDWSWVPGITWASDSSMFFTVTHSPLAGLEEQESSPIFNLSAFLLDNGPLIDLLPQVGMFSYPVTSPSSAGNPGPIALLQAVFPEQSENSRYRLVLVDQDGSNARVIYPPEGSAGLEPQQVVWSPRLEGANSNRIAFIHQGNIWLIDIEAGNLQQLTGDGLITRMDWK